MPLAMVVHSTETSGMQAMTKASAMNTRMTMSLRLREATNERVGLNLSKSMTGAPSMADLGVCVAADITPPSYR